MTAWLKIASIFAASVVLAFSGGYLAGKREGRQLAAVETRETVIQQLRERKLTDEQVDGMSDADLCGAIGGVLQDGRCE